MLRRFQFRSSHFLLLAGAITGGLLIAFGAFSQNSDSNSNANVRVAISSEDREHIHSIVLRTKDISDLISHAGEQGISLESSSGFDGGVLTGTEHSHRVILTRSDLILLQSTGALSKPSEMTLSHTHIFKFMKSEDCPDVILVPLPTPTVSPTPSPSPSPTPTVTPTETPTPTITPTPTVTFTGLPTPLPTFTLITPIPTFTLPFPVEGDAS